MTDEGRVHDVDDGGGGEGRDIDNMLIIEGSSLIYSTKMKGLTHEMRMDSQLKLL